MPGLVNDNEEDRSEYLDTREDLGVFWLYLLLFLRPSQDNAFVVTPYTSREISLFAPRTVISYIAPTLSSHESVENTLVISDNLSSDSLVMLLAALSMLGTDYYSFFNSRVYEETMYNLFLHTTTMGLFELGVASFLADNYNISSSDYISRSPRQLVKKNTELLKELTATPELEAIGYKTPRVPDEFICPISAEIMDDPVSPRASSDPLSEKYRQCGAHVFEAYQIRKWLKINTTNPLNREFLSEDLLIPNDERRFQIQGWLKEKHEKKQMYESCLSLGEKERKQLIDDFYAKRISLVPYASREMIVYNQVKKSVATTESSMTLLLMLHCKLLFTLLRKEQSNNLLSRDYLRSPASIFYKRGEPATENVKLNLSALS